ncbi:MAG TPA: MFS transporter [Bryobacteraceae bacterium]|nr:MFS transporter [Bryobacteraceae bacterium]
MMLCSLISYIDRQTLAVLAPTIMRETRLTTQDYGIAISAFSIAYMLGNPLWGGILDRIGLRAGMIIAVGIWSAASASHALMAGLAGFSLARAALGFGEGATFPAGLRTAFDSLPPRKRSRGIALAYSGGSLGAIITPWIVVPIALHFGWRSAFLFTGLAGVTWLIVWRVFARPPYLPPPERRPERFHLPNPGERRFWALFFGYAFGAFPLAPVLYVAPLVLNRLHGLSQSDLGKLLWIPPLGWEIGYFFWGWVADRRSATAARPVGLVVLLAIMGLPVAAIPAITSASAALAVFCWSMFTASGFIVISLRAAAQAYPSDQTALVAGIGAGSWSAVVAVLLPVVGRMVDHGQFHALFMMIAALPLLGAAGWAVFTLLQSADRQAA